MDDHLLKVTYENDRGTKNLFKLNNNHKLVDHSVLLNERILHIFF